MAVVYTTSVKVSPCPLYGTKIKLLSFCLVNKLHLFSIRAVEMNLENGGSDARLLDEDGLDRIRLEVERLEENGWRRNGWRHGG